MLRLWDIGIPGSMPRFSYPAFVAGLEELGPGDFRNLGVHNVGALIIRIGFWGAPCYNYSIIYPKAYSNYEGPYIIRLRLNAGVGSLQSPPHSESCNQTPSGSSREGSC